MPSAFSYAMRHARLLVLTIAAAVVARAAPVRFDIPAQSAADALIAFTKQASTEVLFSFDDLKKVRARAVVGEFEPEESLRLLLRGTGFAVTRNAGKFVVAAVPAPLPKATSDPSGKTAKPENPANVGPREGGANDGRAARLARATAGLAESDPASRATVELSPFEVRSDKDTGYTATSTLAGSRINTQLRNTSAAISVFTSQFIEDTGALNVTEALTYALNGERDLTDFTGNGTRNNDLQLQFRGFVGASLGRNYFQWTLSSDSYNIERLDFARGPNSILFGIGGPGGILNTSTKRALIGQNVSNLKLRVGSWEDYRGSIDVARSVGDTFAVRVNAVTQDKKSWRDFEYQKRNQAALAATFRPFKNTELRLDAEYGKIDELNGQPWPAGDAVLAWLEAGKPLSNTYGQTVPGATTRHTVTSIVYDPLSGVAPMSRAGSVLTNLGPASPSLGNNPKAIIDESVLPRASNIAGPGYTTDNNFYNVGVFVEQRIGTLSVEAAFNRQHEARDVSRPLIFNSVLLRADPNRLLPNGQPNPGAGKLYIEGNEHLVTNRDFTRDDYRLTGSYDLDLRGRGVGRHMFAALLTRKEDTNETDELRERNITPLANRDLTNAANIIVRRSYLDFSNGDLSGRGLHDPSVYPLIGQGGVNSGMARVGDVAVDNLTRIDSKMIAFQSAFFKDRLWVTGGWREDRQRAWGSGTEIPVDRDPVTRVFGKRTRNKNYTYNDGRTRTYGLVYHFTGWLSVYYNNANNFIPQTNRNLYEEVIGNRKGEGEDMGLRFNLPDGRLSASIGYYTVYDRNRAPISIDGNLYNNIDAMQQTLGLPLLPSRAGGAVADTGTTQGEGWELDVTANPTKSWRLAFNLAQTEQVQSELAPYTTKYFTDERATWAAGSSRPLTGPVLAGVPTTENGLPATVGTALRTAEGILLGIKASEGRTRRQLRKYSANLFNSYTFSSGPLRAVTIGGGGNYRGKPVTGYDSTRGNAPVYGDAYILVNLMAARSFRMTQRLNVRLQINVDNVFDEDDLIVTDKDQTGAYRYVFQTPQRWSVSTSLTF